MSTRLRRVSDGFLGTFLTVGATWWWGSLIQHPEVGVAFAVSVGFGLLLSILGPLRVYYSMGDIA
jgi:hypothetical protein